MKTIGIIQARMNSSRLPGKVLKPLTGDVTLFDFLFSRINNSGIYWWLATTNNQTDDLLVEKAKELGLNIFRGSEEDVLSRYLDIGRREKTDWIVRVTADNPQPTLGIGKDQRNDPDGRSFT